ncbi:uncharacterized protein BDW43DRAFT_315547 [Aspergillus alliaceus]|uniref:uncharacterized protein n=1 Tax=Petromyces alliaceus TaxID=209559 RepID=UPI0012A5FEA2|nr:uncharacterized protein BDW43DRAFT_315547 [Aspergillus alliaceus]KAB8228777.1 hypothetical protein BDW43DRAFT_315547 [Aspergillus alliaceus]
MAHHCITRAVHILNHERSFREAVKSIDQAVGRALPSNKRYDCVRVLTLKYDNDDIGLADIEAELLRLFQNRFHNATDSVVVPSSSVRDATLAIRGKLQSLILQYDTPTTLFIIVYKGYSDANLKQPSLLYISCRSWLFSSWKIEQQVYEIRRGAAYPGATSIPWAFVEADLAARVHADVFVMLDSCFSPGAAMGPTAYEYLAASAFESPAAASIDVSLTRRFVDLLNALETEEITVAQVHAKLVQKANHAESRLLYTPVHVVSEKKPSVTLHPLQNLSREVASLQKTGGLADGKVLVSVLVEGKTSVPNVEQWTKWLATSIPEDVADIKIEAVFESGSSLCLLTLPIAVWDMIKYHESYNFIAFVESNNTLLRRSPAPPGTGALESRARNVRVPHREKQ